ncbi:hypothetical protein F5X68DRAFT_69123 [Plectosphaerella plurivora]|uniref:Uncharacterized protein n=1 Tax=Plectosphaerella plurivora TaxID=936078 RepID=A0A9P9AEP3_9PEZI|nr:hypothetical protein F5X68DRAFT_69123 [Plectosphaerella plurivora]
MSFCQSPLKRPGRVRVRRGRTPTAQPPARGPQSLILNGMNKRPTAPLTPRTSLIPRRHRGEKLSERNEFRPVRSQLLCLRAGTSAQKVLIPGFLARRRRPKGVFDTERRLDCRAVAPELPRPGQAGKAGSEEIAGSTMMRVAVGAAAASTEMVSIEEVLFLAREGVDFKQEDGSKHQLSSQETTSCWCCASSNLALEGWSRFLGPGKSDMLQESGTA